MPWCLFAPLTFAEPRVGKASLSSTAGMEGVVARDEWRLVGLDPWERGEEDTFTRLELLVRALLFNMALELAPVNMYPFIWF